MSNRTKLRVSALAVVALLGTAACASAAGGAGANGAPVPAEKPVMLSVTNQNFADVDVYAYLGDTPMRLTTVRSMNTVELALPANVMVDGNVQLVVDPIGGFNTFTTDPITANPGDTIRLTVAPSLTLSNWTVD